MYKSKLQELFQRRSWNLPEYTTVKDDPDHVPRFKDTAVVNGQWFETHAECKSAKDAQNSVAKMAYDDFNISTSSRVHVQRSPLADSTVIPSRVPACSSLAVLVPEMQVVAPVPQLPQIPVQVSPPPSSLPLAPSGTLHICESEGPPHARHFKSRVSFNGKSYETMEFFPKLKEAEHAAAKFACQNLQIVQIQENGGLYKNLLQELAQKRGLLCPTYKTVR